MRSTNRQPLLRERSFGRSIGAVLVLVALVQAWRDPSYIAAAIGFVGVGLAVVGTVWPRSLSAPARVWWTMAMALGWFNSRVLLTAMFVFVLTPVGLVWRLTGRDTLARRRGAFQGWTTYPERYRSAEHVRRMF